MPIHMLIHMSPNIDTHESTSVSTNKKSMSEDKNKSARQCYHYQYYNSKGNITHEMASTKVVLQAILVQILTVALKLVFCQIQNQYERLHQYFSNILSTLVCIFYQMINMCATTNTNTTIVTTLSTQVPTLCRCSTSDALGRGGFEWASCYRCFGTCKPDASGLALVGNERQKGALRFPNFPTEEMRKSIREEGNLPIFEVKERMPVAGYRVLQSVTTGDEFPLTFLRVQVGKTIPVAATREAISLLGTTGLKDPTRPPVPLARGIARDREEGGMQQPDAPRTVAREDYRGYVRVDFSKKVRLAGQPIWEFEKMEPSKVRETVETMSKEDLTAKIQQASTMIQVLKTELGPLKAEDQGRRASKAELSYWEPLTRNLDAERALQEAMQRLDGEDRIVPVWVRDIADGTDGIEAFEKLREFVEFQNDEIARLRADLSIQLRQDDPASSSAGHQPPQGGATVGVTPDEKERELVKARSDIMEIQLKVYDLQRDLNDEKENRRKDQEKHESVVQGLTSSIESSARREAQLEKSSQGGAEVTRLYEANLKLMDELRTEREKVAKAKDDREQDAADLKRIRAERSSLRDELETVKQRAKLRKDELETARKDLESAERRLEEVRREKGNREVCEENERLRRQLKTMTARLEEVEVANTARPKVKAEPPRTDSPQRRETKAEDEASGSDESSRAGDDRPASVSPEGDSATSIRET